MICDRCIIIKKQAKETPLKKKNLIGEVGNCFLMNEDELEVLQSNSS